MKETQNLLLFFPFYVFGVTEAVVSDSSGENKGTAADVSASQHVMVCALKELGSLVQSLSATAAPLIQEPSIGKKNYNIDSELRDIIHRITREIWFPEHFWKAVFLNTHRTRVTVYQGQNSVDNIALIFPFSEQLKNGND